MSEWNDWSIDSSIAWLFRERQEVDSRISDIYKEKGLVYHHRINLLDVNRHDILTRVMDGFELQMMCILP